MGIYKAEIANMRKSIGDRIGQKILIKEAQGKRLKFEEREATVQQVYKDYFMVKYDNFDRVGSYNYTDLFMKTVQVSTYDGENYIPLYVPEVADRKNKLHKLVTQPTEIQSIENMPPVEIA